MAAHVHLNYLLLTCENRTPEPQQQQQSLQPTVAGLRKQLDVLLKLQTLISFLGRGFHLSPVQTGTTTSCQSSGRAAAGTTAAPAPGWRTPPRRWRAGAAGSGATRGGAWRGYDVRTSEYSPMLAAEISPCIHYD